METYFRAYLPENEIFRKIIFACSFGAQVKFFDQQKCRKSRDTVPLNWVFVQVDSKIYVLKFKAHYIVLYVSWTIVSRHPFKKRRCNEKQSNDKVLTTDHLNSCLPRVQVYEKKNPGTLDCSTHDICQTMGLIWADGKCQKLDVKSRRARLLYSQSRQLFFFGGILRVFMDFQLFGLYFLELLTFGETTYSRSVLEWT